MLLLSVRGPVRTGNLGGAEAGHYAARDDVAIATTRRQPLVKCRARAIAVLPATSHAAVIGQVNLLAVLIKPFLQGETPRGMFV